MPQESGAPETWHYTWDSQDRLVGVVTPDGVRWRYIYDPFGRRMAKQRLAEDDTTVVEQVEFTWHEATMIEQATTRGDSGRAAVITWNHDGLRPITQTETERTTGRSADEPEGDRHFYSIITDLVGTPTHLIDEFGSPVWEARTTLWGVIVGPDSAQQTPLRFPGQYADEETGWYYNYHRHYDPYTGRYTTLDPLGLLPAPNPYTYPHNPQSWIDPLGLAPLCARGALKNWASRSYNFGSNSVHLTKERMIHVLERHHPAFFRGQPKATQTYFDRNMSIADVQNAIDGVLRQNTRQLLNNTDRVVPLVGNVGGKDYFLKIDNGWIAQFYPM
jgi:RHS repeat-associated protein